MKLKYNLDGIWVSLGLLFFIVAGYVLFFKFAGVVNGVVSTIVNGFVR